jgi:hypothetical protein
MYIRLSALTRLQTMVDINEINSCRKSSIRTTNYEDLVRGRVLLDTIHDRGVTGWCGKSCGLGTMGGDGQGGRIWNDHVV